MNSIYRYAVLTVYNKLWPEVWKKVIGYTCKEVAISGEQLVADVVRVYSPTRSMDAAIMRLSLAHCMHVIVSELNDYD
jgi:hypothetical protein